jgi:ferredoxin-NADP reductase
VPDLVLRVSSVRRTTPSASTIRLDLDGAPFHYRAGQVASLGPAGSSHQIPYSIASAPEETAARASLEFLIKTDSAGRWGNHFETLRRGSLLTVRGPSGSFTFPDLPRERYFLFIAGGTGIAPLRSMIRHAVLSRRSGHIRLHYSARTPHDFAYLPELRGMARRGEIGLSLTATREMTPRWRGARGRIVAAQLTPLVEDPATLCFVCGPTSMVAEVPVILQDLGIERGRILVENYESPITDH